MPSAPAAESRFLAEHSRLLLESFRRLLGRDMLPERVDPEATVRALYEADFGLVSHDTQADPIFNYANLTAQRIFEMDWPTFTRTPSRLSVEPVSREERARLMERVKRDGYIDGYSGVRVSATGKRFIIRNAAVWNIIDGDSRYRGQAACFRV